MGNKKIPVNELRSGKTFELEEGKPFSPRRLSEDRNRIAAKYLDKGFLNSEVKTVVSRHEGNANQVDVRYEITENQQVRISQVLYLGQKRTRESLIKQSTNLWPEEPLSQVGRARRRVRNEINCIWGVVHRLGFCNAHRP